MVFSVMKMLCKNSSAPFIREICVDVWSLSGGLWKMGDSTNSQKNSWSLPKAHTQLKAGDTRRGEKSKVMLACCVCHRECRKCRLKYKVVVGWNKYLKISSFLFFRSRTRNNFIAMSLHLSRRGIRNILLHFIEPGPVDDSRICLDIPASYTNKRCHCRGSFRLSQSSMMFMKNLI